MTLNHTDLHSYQKEAIQFGLSKDKCGLYAWMGSGKTIVGLTIAVERLKAGLISKCLIIGPLRVVNTVWHVEISKWLHTQGLTYSICTGNEQQRHEAFQKNVQIYLVNRESILWCLYKGYSMFGMIIVDEASSFKNPSSKRFKALCKFTYKYILLLTGTPAPNGYLDIWSLVYLLDRGAALGKTITRYKEKYFDYNPYSYKYTCKNEKEILKLISPYFLTIDNSNYLDLPQRVDVTTAIRIPNYNHYKKFKNEAVCKVGEEQLTAASAGVLTNKLLQYANGIVYNEFKEEIHIHSAKLDALSDIVEDNPNTNFLVAYNFRSDLNALKTRFKYAVVLDNDEIIEKWNDGKIKMLLAHPSSAGMGLNLQKGGNTIIWYGLTWNLENYLQFNARLHRQGQKNTVVINHLISEGTIDERVMTALANKTVSLQQILNGLI